MLLKQSDRLFQIAGVDYNLHQLGERYLLDEDANILVDLVSYESIGWLADHVIQLGLTWVEAIGELLAIVDKLLDLVEDLGHTGTVWQAVWAEVALGWGLVAEGHVHRAWELLTLEFVVGLCGALNAAVVVLAEDLLDFAVAFVEQDLERQNSVFR